MSEKPATALELESEVEDIVVGVLCDRLDPEVDVKIDTNTNVITDLGAIDEDMLDVWWHIMKRMGIEIPINKRMEDLVEFAVSMLAGATVARCKELMNAGIINSDHLPRDFNKMTDSEKVWADRTNEFDPGTVGRLQEYIKSLIS